MLELKDIAISFRQARKKVKVLDGISLFVQKGEFVSLLGPSGSGKSTLFHIIGGLKRPDSGQVLLEGRNVTGQKGWISYMPQNYSLLPWRSVLDNVILSQEIAGVRKKEAREQAKMWMKRVGLAGYEKAYPHALSGGMQQRAAFLRTLLSPQEIMCLDEPFANLDALTRLDMQRWLINLWEQHKRSVLFITHSIEEALFLSDRIYVLSNKPTAVLEEIRVPFARPRGEETMLMPEFSGLRNHIYALLKKEMEKKDE